MRRILYVAYPLLPVTDESAGGAEQMLATLEREMAARGHCTTVAACEGSQSAGKLIVTGRPPKEVDVYEERDQQHNGRVLEHIVSCAEAGLRYHVVHDKSGSFWHHAAGAGVPVLATLHLPRVFYREEWFAELPPNLFFNCVSEAQARTFHELPHMLGVVPNGIPASRFPFTTDKNDYLLWLGRICEEKGAHIAIEVAARTGMRLIIAGQIYPFSYHQRYYERCVRPYLGMGGSRVTFVDTPTLEQKLELLRHAHAVLVSSLCEETSSLVALEAMACGTPVIAFRRGGIPEVVAHGETGVIVETPEEMAEAVEQVRALAPRACRSRVEAYFTAKRMADDYERLYERIVTGQV